MRINRSANLADKTGSSNHTAFVNVCLILSMLALSLAADYPNWSPSTASFLALGVAVLCACAAVFTRSMSLPEKTADQACFVALAIQFSLLAIHAKLFWLLPVAVLAAYAFARLERGGLWLLAALLAFHVVCSLLVLWASPAPHIDVWVFEDEGVRALLAGKNSYAITFPDILNDPRLYGPGLVQDGRLRFGFPYPPLNLLVELVGYVLGDVRFGHLLATTSAGLFIGLMPGGRRARAAAALLLSNPAIWNLLKYAWIEPVVVVAFVATVYAWRTPRLFPYVLGLFLSTKQYLVLAVPAVAIFEPNAKRLVGVLLKAGGVVLLVCLPFLIWDPHAFIFNIVLLQLQQPFRSDSLSFLAWLFPGGGGTALYSLSFFIALAAGVLAVLVLRDQRSPSAFARVVAVIFVLFFAWSKQAFTNYYLFVLGALAVALATNVAEPALAAYEATWTSSVVTKH